LQRSDHQKRLVSRQPQDRRYPTNYLKLKNILDDEEVDTDLYVASLMSTRKHDPARRSLRLRASLRNLAVGVPALAMLMAADGDCAFDWLTAQSPVQAVASVMIQPDGEVVAELTLVSTEDWDSRWADGATHVELRVPDGTIIELEPIGEGRYRADSGEHPELLWMPGERYRVTFELDDEELAGKMAGEDFIAVVDAPAEDVEFTLERAPAFVGDTADLRWTPSSLDALIEVYDPDGTLIFTTFNMAHPEFDGSKWGSLAHNGRHTLPVDVFDVAGSYTISACVVASQEGFDAELSAALGLASGFLAGECFEPIEFEVVE
jgi:hypothetical protein